MRKLISKRLLNNQGQVAIFIALIFQVLFLFFAMIINVGLLVHHKINLQNSVDLAAYYGAMKQGEMLNGIGHINYQIRQSWKLLSWRYRQLGTAGDYNLHPYNKMTRKVGQSPLLPQGDDYDGYPQSLTGTFKDYYEAPAFCITYSPFTPMPGSESTCKDQSMLSTINLFKAPANIAGFNAINATIKEAAVKALNAAVSRCKYVGQFNYMILAQFMVAYNFDQGERKQLINLLSRGLSESPEDFRELNGKSAKVGIEETLKRNLTQANRDSVKFKVWNGLGQDGCNAVGVPPEVPAKFLSEIKISPAFMYMDSICSANDGISPKAKELTGGATDLPYYLDELKPDIEQLKNFVDPLQPPYNSSVGVEKNPWCMSYVGVSAEATPKIPFALGGIKLKARAYAKPFGGKIGPWYKSQWTRDAKESKGGDRVDPLLPWRIGDPANTAGFKDPTRVANYSRYVGDTSGMKSRAVQGQWGRAVYNLSLSWSGTPIPAPGSAAADNMPPDWDPLNGEPNFFHWGHIAQNIKAGKTGDLLAWDSVKNTYPRMRDLEIAAILPDQFDITYYSIEPDFYKKYYLPLVNEYTKNPEVPKFDYLVRSDLGQRIGDKDREKFSIKDQYKVWSRVETTDFEIQQPRVDFEKKLLYVVKDIYHVLTSWIGTDLTNYDLDDKRFGKCLVKTKDTDPATTGDCVIGGRAGYSVKMVSSDYLQGELELGGVGVPADKLLNPPDPNF